MSKKAQPKAQDEGKLLSKLKVQVEEFSHSFSELNLLVEKTISQAERDIKRLGDLKKSKSAAQATNRDAIDNAETAVAEDAQDAIRAASSAIEATKADIKACADSAIELGEKKENLRVKILGVPMKIDEIEKAVRALGNQARGFQTDLRGMHRQIGKLWDLCRRVK